MRGTIYIVATPIGNLDDITLRALETLRTVDIIACEDTRHTSKLLFHYDIKNKLTPYHDHNKEFKTPHLIEAVESGMNVAIVSDAGTPMINDPGFYLIREALKNEIDIVPIPGASSILTALVGSGLPVDRFSFEGYLPRKKGRTKRLKEIKETAVTMIFFEGPHRLVRTLRDLREFLGDRQAVVARELTKIHEEYIRGDLSDTISHFGENKPRGEFVIMVKGKDK